MATNPRPCAKCRELIPIERVELLPDTRLCVACSTKLGSEFDVTLTPQNLSKSGSMKKNYSSFELKKERREMRRD